MMKQKDSRLFVESYDERQVFGYLLGNDMASSSDVSREQRYKSLERELGDKCILSSPARDQCILPGECLPAYV